MTKQNARSTDLSLPSSPMLPTLRLRWSDVLTLVLGYVVLDWASYIHPLYGLNITAWNPAPALGLIFLLRFGKLAFIPLALAILMADAWVRNLPVSLPVSVGLSLVLALGYWSIAEVLRHRLSSRSIFEDRRGLFDWAGIITVGTLLNSVCYVATLSAGGIIAAGDMPPAFIRYWVGDGVGVLVSMPILWMLLDDHGRAQLRAMAFSRESLVYLLATGVTLWIAFGVGAAADFKYFYVLFLPVVWAAARQGLAGAVLSTAIVQIGIIGSVQLLGFSAITVLEIQALAAALALFGFFIGIVVDEKQRVSAELRQTLRLAAAGEMAGALAHELNQPLTALSAYGIVCEKLIGQGETGDRLREAIHRMVAESSRAADVVRRLRDFFRTGATQLELVDLDDLLDSALDAFAKKAQQQGVELVVEARHPCTILADRLQLEVVLRNLLANAFDAVAECPAEHRRVRVSASPEAGGRVCIRVEDSGQGLSGATAARLFEAFHSSKACGLGLGLVISRAIVEAHGGHLAAEVADHGLFTIVLPSEGDAADAA
jgi:two-component system, LuxR family, sensor kinase FixL